MEWGGESSSQPASGMAGLEPSAPSTGQSGGGPGGGGVIPDEFCHWPGPLPTLRQAIQQVERRLLAEALRRTGGNKSRTARVLGISRRALQYKMEAYGLEGEFGYN